MANNSKIPGSLKQALDSSTETLDSATLARLRRARQEALAQTPAHSAPRWWIPIGAAGATAVAILIATWMTTVAPQPQAHVDTMEDIDILASTDNTDLYEQMDFFEWLESQQDNDKTNAG